MSGVNNVALGDSREVKYSDLYNLIFEKREPHGFIVDHFLEVTDFSANLIRAYFSRLERRFTSNTLDPKTHSELTHTLLQEPSEENIEALLNQQFPGLRRMGEIEKYRANEDSWRGIDRLGLEYFREVQKGYGHSVDTRSEKQVKIVNEIITRTLPYIERIAQEFIEGKFMPVRKEFELDEEGEPKLVIKGFRAKKYEGPSLDNQELVNYGVEGIIKSMHTYLPEASAMSGFIRVCVSSAIAKGLNKYEHLVKIPLNLSDKLKKGISQSSTREEAIETIRDITGKNNPYFLNLIYDSLKNDFLNIGGKKELEEFQNRVFEHDPDADILNDELSRILNECLGKLTDRERRIIEMHFGFYDEEQKTHKQIADLFEVSGGRIGQIESRALRRLSHPRFKDKLNAACYSVFGVGYSEMKERHTWWDRREFMREMRKMGLL